MPAATAPAVDLVLHGGQLVDGTGAPARNADIAVKDGRVVAVEPGLRAEAGRRIDTTAMTVVPGFIDPHSHSDWSILGNRDAESTIRQGVTTEVVGNCGVTYGPVGTSDVDATRNALRAYGFLGEVTWRSFAELLDVVHRDDGGTAQNLAWFVGHTALRNAAEVRGTGADAVGITRMVRHLEEAMDAGAIGMSSGLEYGSGRDATTEELTSVAAVLARYDGIYASHIRNRDAHLLDAVDEFLTIARHNGLRAQLSHLNVRHDTGAPPDAWHAAVGRLIAEREAGMDVLADMTPYPHGIGLATGLLPGWLLADGPATAAQLLADAEIRTQLRGDCDRYWRFVHKGQWDRVVLATSPATPELEGLPFTRIAELRGQDCWDAFFDVLHAAGTDMPAVQLMGRLFTAEHVAEAIAHPLFCLGVDGFTSRTDGPLAARTRHPLFFTGHTHYIAHHVLQARNLTLEEAVRKMTSKVAERFALRGRGRVEVGACADLAVLDLETLAAQDTFAFTGSYATGVPHVVVNGQLVVHNGQHLGTRAGQYLPRR
ncbi:N-acyl-D-amino-acid deacylase [Tamaricihabitans halophyticus]|uniref:N-acyl-D-amino-acid deacylase n=1 Tax=Tamaricihabitans halophyticus TaxID=1262583 RepID=A0A4R2PXI1_9PSEU|nr:amidohydrolase family protein [Tamaricihabitans halophyticus]TCP40757.1 N-acyl-D-amino-acid deacylase [Tamaricihabitans halophyticus]